jgi:hypothetical protein
MVIVRLEGGLGNQLFQYAAGRAIAQRHNVPLKLDTSKFEGTRRRYALDNLRISASLATASEVEHLTGSNGNGMRPRLTRLYQRYLPYYRQSVFVERGFQFDPNFFRARCEVYLIGYWQSEKYFEGIAPLLREELTLLTQPDPDNQAMASQIEQTESVSVHIRRGDYVSDEHTSRYHGSCSLAYYQDAVGMIARTGVRPAFFVFSDDIEWAKQNLRLDHPVVYVSHNGEARDYEDLRLMSLCKHHIIANSSFSWWGAWLSENPEKKVIVPRRWFDQAQFDTRDLIPAGWNRF